MFLLNIKMSYFFNKQTLLQKAKTDIIIVVVEKKLVSVVWQIKMFWKKKQKINIKPCQNKKKKQKENIHEISTEGWKKKASQMSIE